MVTQRDQIHSLLAECLDRIETEGRAAVDRLCGEHPELAEELRSHVASLEKFGLLRAPAKSDAERMPDRLGEFRLIRQLGSGGMGVVYLAEQTSLKREVALKLVRPEHLFFPGARERFVREVAIIAKLQHPGIVPVYTVGEENGVPYYAMERVAGCTLAEVIAEVAGRRADTLSEADLEHAVVRRTRARSSEDAAPAAESDEPLRATASAASWIDTCVRLVAKVADALDHAHQRGVIHRDLKPSNVMVTPEGRVMLLDFGLASTEEVSRITRSGSQVGSLPYMAPEQVRGDARGVDARTDVYQLGVTLFELLALRLPYADESAEETRRQILEATSPPLRALNRRVPWDVETVCLTAMERDPVRRYATAAAFRADLENLLARRPITARRPGPLLRAQRFAQRRPAITVGAALGFLIVVGGPLAWVKFERGKRKELQEEKDRTDQQSRLALAQSQLAMTQRQRAEGHFRRVLEAVGTLLEPLLRERSDELPEMTLLRREVLERALAVYEGFGPEDAEDPALRREIAAANVNRGRIQWMLDQAGSAEAVMTLGVRELEALHEQKPDDVVLTMSLGDALLRLGASETSAAGEAPLRRAIALLLSVPADHPRAREARRMAADARGNLAEKLHRQGRHEEGELEARATLAVAESLRAEDPDDPDFMELEAFAHLRLGEPLALAAAGTRRAEGMNELEAARRGYEAFAAKTNGRRQALQQLQLTLFRLARGHDLAGELDAGAEAMSAAHEIMEELASRFPEVTWYSSELGEVKSGLGYFRLRQGRIDEARELLQRACTLLGESAERAPAENLPPILLANALARLAEVEVRRGDLAAALAAYDEALVRSKVRFGTPPAWLPKSVHDWRWDRIGVIVLADDLDLAADEVETLAAETTAGFDGELRAATLLARCAVRAAAMETLPEDERLRRAAGFEDEALAHLAAAIERGFKPTAAWLKEPALERLVARDEAREILASAGLELPAGTDAR